jgi:ZIP family zinc transporter
MGGWITLASDFGGIAFIGVIDALIPKAGNPHEPRLRADLSRVKGTATEAGSAPQPPPHKLMRTGMFTASAIAIHNCPEGMVVFLAALEDPQLGIVLAIAVALHNISEGVSVSVPIYYASGSRRRAFGYSVLSGLSEPLGALVGFLVLRPFLTDHLTGCSSALWQAS